MSEMKIKKGQSRSYNKSCSLIYELTSQRIREKYDIWAKKNTEFNTQSRFYPEDSKLIGKVMNNKRTDNNKYLITPAIQNAIMENLGFEDVNTLYWGDVESYFQRLFTILLLEAQEYHDYSTYWQGISLSTEADISDFYKKNHFLLVDIRPTDNQMYKPLLDQFVDFTYNKIDYFRFDSVSRIGEYVEDEFIYKKDGVDTLTFVRLPEKLDVFTGKVLIPFISSICLNNRIS